MTTEQPGLPGVEAVQPKTKGRKLPCGCVDSPPWSSETLCHEGERLFEEREALATEERGSEEHVAACNAFLEHLKPKAEKAKRGAKSKDERPETRCTNCGAPTYGIPGSSPDDKRNGALDWCNYCDGIRTRIAEEGVVAMLGRTDLELDAEEDRVIVDRAIRIGELLAKRLRGKS